MSLDTKEAASGLLLLDGAFLLLLLLLVITVLTVSAVIAVISALLGPVVVLVVLIPVESTISVALFRDENVFSKKKAQ